MLGTRKKDFTKTKPKTNLAGPKTRFCPSRFGFVWLRFPRFRLRSKVCQKWLKDRKGRTLSEGDIAHYHKIVVALHETIRLMAEIDQTIAAHGGWPAALQPAPAK